MCLQGLIATLAAVLTYIFYTSQSSKYHVAGKFGGGKVWRIDSFLAFGERKFSELIDQPIDC